MLMSLSQLNKSAQLLRWTHGKYGSVYGKQKEKLCFGMNRYDVADLSMKGKSTLNNLEPYY